jgi:hypothetical protein
LTPVSLLGWLIWIVSEWQMLKYWQRLKKQPSLLPIFNDELIENHRLKAFAIGFAAMGVTQMLIVAFASSWDFSALLGAKLSIFVGVVATLSAFLMYDRV